MSGGADGESPLAVKRPVVEHLIKKNVKKKKAQIGEDGNFGYGRIISHCWQQNCDGVAETGLQKIIHVLAEMNEAGALVCGERR